MDPSHIFGYPLSELRRVLTFEQHLIPVINVVAVISSEVAPRTGVPAHRNDPNGYYHAIGVIWGHSDQLELVLKLPYLTGCTCPQDMNPLVISMYLGIISPGRAVHDFVRMERTVSVYKSIHLPQAVNPCYIKVS